MATEERVVAMANQIAKNIAVQGGDDAAAATAAHIRTFWDRRMKNLAAARLAAGGEGYSPIARAAVERLCEDRSLARTAGLAKGDGAPA